MEYMVIWYLLDIIITIALGINESLDFKYIIALSIWTIIFIVIIVIIYIKGVSKDMVYVIFDIICILSIWAVRNIDNKFYIIGWMISLKILNNVIRLIK